MLTASYLVVSCDCDSIVDRYRVIHIRYTGIELTGLNWRVLVGLSSAPLLLILFMWNHLPESPRFDLLHGNVQSLQKTLEAVAKDNGKSMPKG